MSIEQPVDGEVVEMWCVSHGGGGYYIDHVRVTYHANTPWEDHPWGREPWSSVSQRGAPFVDQWSIDRWDESARRWFSGGRGTNRWVRDRLADDNVFTTYEEARDCAVRWATDRISYLTDQIEGLRRQAERFGAGALR